MRRHGRDRAAPAPRAFAASAGRDADLLIVIAPGVERFGYFRQLAQIMTGQLSPDTLLREQERYDTYFDDSPTWANRRSDR
jgi:hypothetical protein